MSGPLKNRVTIFMNVPWTWYSFYFKNCYVTLLKPINLGGCTYKDENPKGPNQALHFCTPCISLLNTSFGPIYYGSKHGKAF